MARLFGTDGVRGVANTELTPELAMALGKAGACVLAESKKRPLILIAKDTRISGDMLEDALTAGILSTGGDVIKAGVLPTPGVAYLVRELHADAGVVISASHNPYEYNGIKFFNSEGFKLDDAIEDEIEAIATGRKEIPEHCLSGAELGRIVMTGKPASRVIRGIRAFYRRSPSRRYENRHRLRQRRGVRSREKCLFRSRRGCDGHLQRSGRD